jgi:hypothetical protein
MISTFIEKPDGIVFFGQSNEVPCILIPDSISMTALLSGLDEDKNIFKLKYVLMLIFLHEFEIHYFVSLIKYVL